MGATTRAINKTRAEGAAWKIWDTYGFGHPRQIPLIGLAHERNVIVKGGGLLGAEARLVRVGDTGILRVKNLALNTGRSRFAIAHELGHWILHLESQGFTCSSQDLRDYRKRPEEAEANIFASYLLMPLPFVKEFIASRDVSMRTASEMAEDFNVSLTAASIRMMQFCKHDCVLVFSKKGCVQWWVSRADRFGIWLESKQPLSCDSTAFHLNDSDPGEFQEDDVPFESWFRHYDHAHTPLLTEQSKYLAATGGTLTLLAIAD